MSKWNNNLREKIGTANECFCSTNQGLFIPNRQLSVVVALLLFLLFSAFITGYFFGKQYCVDQFLSQLRQDSFADGAYSSLLNATSSHDHLASKGSTEEAKLLTSNNNNVLPEVPEVINQTTAETKEYYAELIGFGTEKAAVKFSEKLALRNITTTVKKRISKTAKGRITNWYQVITAMYSNKEMLQLLVHDLEKKESLRGVKIITC